MKKEQVIIVGLIVLCGISLLIFGRTRPGPDPDASERLGEVLLERKLPVQVIVQASTPEGQAAITEVRSALNRIAGKKAKVVVVDMDNPNEKQVRSSKNYIKLPTVVVMGLDGGRRAFERHAFDDIGVKRSLRQKPGVRKLPGLALKELDEEVSDDLSLPFGVRHPFETAQEELGRIHIDEIDLEMIPKDPLNTFRLALSEYTVVHKDAVKPVSNGPMQEDGHH